MHNVKINTVASNLSLLSELNEVYLANTTYRIIVTASAITAGSFAALGSTWGIYT